MFKKSAWMSVRKPATRKKYKPKASDQRLATSRKYHTHISASPDANDFSVLVAKLLRPNAEARCASHHSDSTSSGSALGGSGPAMKYFQGDNVKGGRQNPHDQCEDHSEGAAYSSEVVAPPNHARVGAS